MSENIAKTVTFFPKRLVIESAAAGKVFVTKHGWDRFLERSGLDGGRSYAHYLHHLQDSFGRARKVRIDPKLRVKRKKQHDDEAQHYFYDQEMNIWYVVLPAEGLLVTVVNEVDTGRDDMTRTKEGEYV